MFILEYAQIFAKEAELSYTFILSYDFLRALLRRGRELVFNIPLWWWCVQICSLNTFLDFFFLLFFSTFFFLAYTDVKLLMWDVVQLV